VKLRRDAVARQKLLQDILPAAKSLSSGLSKLSLWLDEADSILSSHCISGDLVSVVERINKHKVHWLFVVILLMCLIAGLV